MKRLMISLKVFLLFTIITGVVYPLLITGIAQIAFPVKANGSIISTNEGKAEGSALVGQAFDSVIYFSSRPSAIGYNPLPSGGSNLGLTNKKLKELVAQRRLNFIINNHLDSLAVLPPEMLFSSASGLDPHISPQSAFLQYNRVADARNFTNKQKLRLKQLIENQIEPPQFLVLGEERVNVLLLNIGLDNLANESIENK
ncbi:MAG TPA: potassium-transporting ATPase subunit KdpC [Bacteroidales bacterium]|nr:potassium-transporting ATPase subunit KdpC [Bacteroidales bacterium]HPT22201.1 potassium-transporting ATPase subunit KdpC [Bacteroidales bacterium]